MKVLILGSSGFIGRHLCLKLLKENHKVWCIDNLQTSTTENIKEFINDSNFAFMKYDIIDVDLIKMFEGIHVDQIYHLACAASPNQYQKHSIHTLRTCFEGTLNILNLASIKSARILFTSTSEIYGDPLVHPQTEEYNGNVNPLSVRSCYDEGKRVAETLFIEHHRNYGVEIRIARIFNTYGPFLNKFDGRVVSNFISQAINNEPLTVYGEGNQTRSFCYVDDNIEGLLKLMNCNNLVLNTQPINIGNDTEKTILEIAKLIIETTSSESKLAFLDLPEDDPKIRCPDISKANMIIDWKPRTQLQEGIQKTIEYFRANGQDVIHPSFATYFKDVSKGLLRRFFPQKALRIGKENELLLVLCKDDFYLCIGSYKDNEFCSFDENLPKEIIQLDNGLFPNEVSSFASDTISSLDTYFWHAFGNGMFVVQIFYGDKLWTKVCPSPIKIEKSLCGETQFDIWISNY